MSKLASTSLFGLILSIGLLSCGGGGGGSSSGAQSGPAISVDISPTSIAYAYPAGHQGLNTPRVSATVTISDMPGTPIYPVIAASSNILAPGPCYFTNNGNGVFTGTVGFNQDLPAGVYAGSLFLNLYMDSAHTSPYTVTGGTVPFTVTVTPAIVLTATINGVPASLSSLNVKSGDNVEVDSSIPVDWFTTSSGGIASNVTSTQYKWTGKILYGISTSGGQGLLNLNAQTPLASNTDQALATARFFVTE